VKKNGGDGASANLLPSDTDFTFNIDTDFNADLPHHIVANSVSKQELTTNQPISSAQLHSAPIQV